jgi:hypothetical protein
MEMSCPFVPIGVEICPEEELTGGLEVTAELHPTSAKPHNVNAISLVSNCYPMTFPPVYQWPKA